MSFLRFAPVFVMFLLPFVVSFHVLLGEERGLPSFFATLIRTLVMMIGEFDYEDSVVPKATLLTYTMFFLFLFTVTVFLMNLLIGLAVSDTTRTLEKASRTRTRLQIETIQHVETIMPETLRRKCWRGFRKLKDPERDEHWLSIAGFRQCFRWLGLSKNAMRQEMSIYLGI
uniref:Ion transport domain-containing protein n=1 Tax=Panagrolaimus davidi TaxID=227884 RepID=A0A914PVC5_9BILA